MHGLDEIRAMNERGYRRWLDQQSEVQHLAVRALLEAIANKKVCWCAKSGSLCPYQAGSPAESSMISRDARRSSDRFEEGE
jgi:hypothetical protein